MATTQQQPTRRNRRPLALLVTALISALTLAAAFGLLAAGVDLFWVAFPIGYGAVLPFALATVAFWTAADK